MNEISKTEKARRIIRHEMGTDAMMRLSEGERFMLLHDIADELYHDGLIGNTRTRARLVNEALKEWNIRDDRARVRDRLDEMRQWEDFARAEWIITTDANR